MIREEHVRYYKEHGFIVIKQALDRETVTALSTQVSLISSVYPELMVTEKSKTDGRDIPFQLRCFVHKSAWLKQWILEAEIFRNLESLTGGACNLIVDSFKFKYPGGGDFHAHQDMQGRVIEYLNRINAKPDTPRISNVITICIAVDPQSVENGCLEVADGMHKYGFLGQQGENIDLSVADKFEFTPLFLNPGDVVYFDGYLPHRSLCNRSNTTRKAFFLFFNRAEEGDYYPFAQSFFGV